MEKLDIAIQSWFDVGDFNIPLYIHIRDIDRYQPDTLDKKIDLYRDELRVNLTENPFQENIRMLEFKENILYYLRFVDSRRMFNSLKDNFAYHFYRARNVEELYYALMQAGFTETNFINMTNEIIFYINQIKTLFIQRVIELLDYDRKFPTLHLKEKMPKQYQELLQYTNDMSKFQSGIEYSPVIIFPENLGKPLIEFSWRETEFKCLYISMKNKIEGFLNTYQSWKMEQSRNDK